MEELDYNMLFRWFVGPNMDDPIWDATVFTKNRKRLPEGKIAEAFDQGANDVIAWEGKAATAAGGIAYPLTGYEHDGTYALRIVRESGGFASRSTDEQVLRATRDLTRKEGVFSEPTAAVPLATLGQVNGRPDYWGEQTVVRMVTGRGLRQVGAFKRAVSMPNAI